MRFDLNSAYLGSAVFDGMPLFAGDPARCGRCGDIGVWITPKAVIEICPRIQCGDSHEIPNAASKLIERAGRSLLFRKIPANPHAFSIARELTKFTTGEPCDRQLLIDKYFTWAGSDAVRLRHLHGCIQELRGVWLLPVGSRKSGGYWIITDEADYREWFDSVKSSPLTQLSMIHRNAKANFPILAEQMELEFWQDFGDDSEISDLKSEINPADDMPAAA